LATSRFISNLAAQNILKDYDEKLLPHFALIYALRMPGDG
jgi:hypothetical protein